MHIGIGGFHRAYQAMYLDRPMQNGPYTLVEKAPGRSRTSRVIGSIVDYLLAAEDPDAVIEAIAAPEIRIVSLTITEGGYCIDPASGEVDIDNPELQADREPGAVPETVFGLVTEALARRRERGLAGPTILSCENIRGNADTETRHVLSSVRSRHRDPDLAAWIAAQVTFPYSMVDRTTPATTDGDREQLAEDFGVRDARPVVCEDFEQ